MMQTLAISEKNKNSSSVAWRASNRQPFFAPVTVQPKLALGEPDDPCELEADRKADEVMQMPEPVVQREINKREKETLWGESKTEGISTNSDTFQSPITSLQGRGEPLPGSTRRFFESRFDHDFSDVKIHTDQDAAKSAESIHALAYTHKNNIVFREGRYSPNTDTGKRLIGHELTHVVQQENSAPAVQKYDEITQPRGGTSVHSPVVDELLVQVSDVHSALAGRWLVPAEEDLVRTVFGNSIDYSQVRLIIGDLAAGTTAGNNIRLPDNYDFGNAEDKQMLVHEMAHVWQYQHHGAGYITTSLLQQLDAAARYGNRNFAYAYEISEGDSFFDFAPEQQAFIVENYYAMLRDQQLLSTPAGATQSYRSNHLDARGFNAVLTAEQRRDEISTELPLHEPLIRQMAQSQIIPEEEFLELRQRDLMIMPAGQDFIEPVGREQMFTPVPSIFSVHF